MLGPDAPGKHPRKLMMATRGENIALLHVVLKNTPGALLAVVELAAKKHVNILSGYHEVPARSEVGHWTFFFELPAGEISLDEFLDSIKELKVVVEVSAKGPSKFLVDSTHFPLVEQGERVVAFFARSFLSLEKSYLGMMGKAGETALYIGGRAIGSAQMRLLRDWSSLTGRELIEQQSEYWSACGMGDWEVDEFDETKGTARFVVRDSVEVSMYTERQLRPVCHFQRGMAAGSVEELINKKADVKETQCKAMGHPSCIIQVNAIQLTTSAEMRGPLLHGANIDR